MNSTELGPVDVRDRVARPLNIRATRYGQRLAFLFLIVQFLSQALLIVEELGNIRMAFRIVGFASALVMLFLLRGQSSTGDYPVKPLAMIFFVILTFGLIHPNSNTLMAATAQIVVNLAVWSPILWTTKIKGSARFMRKFLLLFWSINLLGTIVGVLQVYDPERFSPSPTFIRRMMGTMADGLQITLEDGRQIWRPMGLSDSPGGAAVAGTVSVILGMGIAATERNWMLRLIAVGGAGAGMFCVYICQVRSLFIMSIVGVAVYFLLMTLRQRLKGTLFLLLTVPAVLAGAYAWATAVGGVQVVSRLDTLAEQPAVDVYYSNRGMFLETTINDLVPQYPLGAGLGRWGMTLSNFGDPSMPDSRPIWVEIQITGWLLDGGLPLVFMGYLSLIFAFIVTLRLALRSKNAQIADMATVLASLNLSQIMVTFNYPVFISQMGVSFWLLNGLLFTSACTLQRQAQAKREGV